MLQVKKRERKLEQRRKQRALTKVAKAVGSGGAAEGGGGAAEDGGAAAEAGGAAAEQRPQKRKRAPHGFMLFMKEKRAVVAAENSDFTFAQISKEVGVRWKALSDEQRAVFTSKAKAAAEAAP